MKREHAPFAGCPIGFPTRTWRVQVLDFADADTATVKVDSGWFNTHTIDIRLADIDTWERFTGATADREKGRAAWGYAMVACAGRWALLSTSMDAEKYGRILGTLTYLGADGAMHDLSAELRERCYAKTPT